MNKRNLFILAGLLTGATACAQAVDTVEKDTLKEQQLGTVTITARRAGTSRVRGAENAIRLNREELCKAACCNLGESFTTNPAVDVNYSDAATGAKQIKLLGLSGTYVQMLTENLPNFRGAAAPFALDYVPGPWMNSISVSKGCSSVRNGYEAITGQINVQYLEAESEPGVTVNLYGNTKSRFDANADASVSLGEGLSTVLLLHYQDDFADYDDNNDGFVDQPSVRQYNLQNRWELERDHYILHAGIGLLKEQRDGGQTANAITHDHPLYIIGVETDRYEGYMKHAFILSEEHPTSIALMGNVSLHQTAAAYGNKFYDVNQKNAYAQLAFESSFTDQHNLSAGLSLNHDYLKQAYTLTGREPKEPAYNGRDKETVAGIYAQYTYTPDSRWTLMAGLRADHSSLYGTFATPRFHVKFTPADIFSLRLSAGKGYRTVHAMAENHYLLASGRDLVIEDLDQESAWNYGASASLNIPLLGKTLKLNAEYYHTRFQHQAIIDYDTNDGQIRIANLDGKSYSNTFQLDATYPVLPGLELTAAWRISDVKATYGGQLKEKPLTNRYKGLLTASYKTPNAKWQVDATAQLNGGGRIPPYTSPDATTQPHSDRFHAYEQLQFQVTRWFRQWSVYVGGENLTGFRQQQPIIEASNPWSSAFDATMVWGPVHGATFYAGVRVNIGRTQ